MSAEIKVVHLLPNLAIGGGPRYVLNFIQGSPAGSPIRHHVCGITDGGMRATFEAAGIPTFVLAGTSRGGLARSAQLLAGIVRQRGIDIIHSNGTAVDRLVGQGASALSGARFVMSFQSVPLSDMFKPQGARQLRIILRQRSRMLVSRVLAHAKLDGIVAISELVGRRRALALGLPEDAFTVITPGLPPSALAPPSPEARQRIRAELGIGDEPVLVNVGRFDIGKGQEVLVEAMPAILDQHPETRLVLAGDGSCRAAVAELAESRGVTARVHFLGTRSDVGDVLAAGDVFVVASASEGFGIAVLEAMAKGLPIVAAYTEINAVTEFVTHGESGLLVDGLAASAMADAVLQILDDDDLAARLAAGAAQEAAARTAAASTAKLEAFYLDLAARPGRRRWAA